MSSDVFTAVHICILVFWFMETCSIVDSYHRFGGASNLRLQDL